MDGRELTDYDPIERRNAAGIKLSSNTISNTTSHHTTSAKKSKVENIEKKYNGNISSLPHSYSPSDDKQNTHTLDICHNSSTSTTHQISSDSTYNSPSSLTPFYSSSSSPASNRTTSIPPSNAPSPSSLEKRLSSLHAEMEELRAQTEPIEKERDFYFAKLQKVEEICMKDQDNEIVKKILDVLFEIFKYYNFKYFNIISIILFIISVSPYGSTLFFSSHIFFYLPFNFYLYISHLYCYLYLFIYLILTELPLKMIPNKIRKQLDNEIFDSNIC